MAVVNPTHQTLFRRQHTLKKEVSFSGIGIHTGERVNMNFLPAKEGTGILFKRSDLAAKPIIPATVEYVCDTSRATTLGIRDIRIHTVEHVLAALKSHQVDNLIIEIDAIEPPVGTGGSDLFVEMIEEAGLLEQAAQVPIVKIRQPVYWSEGDIHIVALPYDGYRISYTLNYPQNPILHAQYHTTLVNQQNFKSEIAPCRTFSLWEEVSFLMDKGLVKGASLDNGVVIKGSTVLSKGGLFFSNEMARHKILDMIGDLSLVGFDFHAHILAIRAGHHSNYAFAKKLYNYITMESS